MRSLIRSQLVASLDPLIVDELLETHTETKRNFHLGGLRLAEVEGGRFCEAAFRLLEQITTNQFTPLGTSLDTEKLIRDLSNTPRSRFPDSVRLHIPRAMRLVYDIRNKRDAAHLSDGIDPNLQDASLVVSVLDWVLAEFVRLFHGVTPDDAQRIVNALVSRATPIVQDFDGFLKVLDSGLKAGDHCIVLLYQRGAHGATIEELKKWARPTMLANLSKTLHRLVNQVLYAHFDGVTYFITYAGERYVEENRLVSFD